ncbi:MAG: NADP-specific glutamate dehydrogenase [Actinobacteria bacterium]|nr:NADP-specific glutamate dehydrogenase [Actinomycetota bacterium]
MSSTQVQASAQTLSVESFMAEIAQQNPAQPEFIQAVHEVAEKVIPFINANPKYLNARILRRMTEADRIIIFRISWQDDAGQVQVNRGYRVQFNNAIGPYKGGLRFDPSVNLGVLKFLGFEQIFKNALTTLPMGGAKGGSNFNPKGKSDAEVMRFCQAYMTELFRHIGHFVDVPAGDIGVGGREVSYLFGQYKRLTNEFTGSLTGKGLSFGGSAIRMEATGYGAVYFAKEMMAHRQMSMEGKVATVSGSGNVALYAAEKLVQLGAKVVTLSDRHGYIYDEQGLTLEKLAQINDIKTNQRRPLSDYAKAAGCEYVEGQRPWGVACDMAFPCATQNEISVEEAKTLLANGCQVVSEGANMPTVAEGAKLFEEAKIMYGPGKAANAGGVAISGIEMTQNSMRLSWTREEVDQKLQEIMASIHEQCVEYGDDGGTVNYVKGANIAGFVKVADTMLAYGVV